MDKLSQRVYDLESNIGAASQFQMVEGVQGRDDVDATYKDVVIAMPKHTVPRVSPEKSPELNAPKKGQNLKERRIRRRVHHHHHSQLDEKKVDSKEISLANLPAYEDMEQDTSHIFI